jgi:hypothetical protein
LVLKVRDWWGWGGGGGGFLRGLLRFQYLFVVYYKRKGEIKREYRNWCRYNERLNDETGGSETPLTLIIRVKGELKRVV